MDFGGVLVLGIIWLLFNLIGQGKGRARTTQPGTAPRPTPQPRPGGSADPTQQEGSRLERMLRELERSLGEVGGTLPSEGSRVPVPPRPSQPPLPVPPTEEVEERESLEEPYRPHPILGHA